MIDYLHARLFPCKARQIEKYKEDLLQARNQNERLLWHTADLATKQQRLEKALRGDDI